MTADTSSNSTGVAGDDTSSSSGLLDSTGGTDQSTTAGSTSSVRADCGNGIVEGDEECDDFAESPGCDADCTLVECGDGVVNTMATEVCDGDDLLGLTCMDLGYDEGILACDAGCEAVDTSGCVAAPALMLGFSAIKQFDFTWEEAAGAEYYQLYESAAPGEPFLQVGDDLAETSVSLTMSLPARYQASYYLSACNATACADSAVVDVTGSLAEAVGYFKASNTGITGTFGRSVALSADGTMLAVGADRERSAATGINGNQADDSAFGAGAVYVFTQDAMGTWSQHSYIKASNTGTGDYFGHRVALSAGGTTLAVSALGESSGATGIDGDQTNDSAGNAGAVYVFTLDGMGAWSQQAYIKASNTDTFDYFGHDVALSADGDTLAVGAEREDSGATGIDGNQADDSAFDAGAAYVFARDDTGAWSQQAYVKASNADAVDHFGHTVALSAAGDTLVVGAGEEDSGATGIDGDQADDSAFDAGAAYVFTRDGAGAWSQQAYIKASNTDGGDFFGRELALSGDGLTLAVGAMLESSNATGIDGDQTNDSIGGAGAVYVFVQDAMGQWSQQAYVKASNPDSSDSFGGTEYLMLGCGLALSDDGSALAVAAVGEDSAATGLGGDQADDSAGSSGAVYTFTRDGMGTWSPQAYVKAPNTNGTDYFGYSVAFSADGSLLAVGAHHESSNATGIGGNQANNQANNAGAVFLY